MKCHLSSLSSLLAVVVAVAFSITQTTAADFATTNTEALAHFWAAIGSSNRPVTVLSFGDSMADSFRSPTCFLMNKLVDRFGAAGYSLNNSYNSAIRNHIKGASWRLPDYYWFTGYSQVPTGSVVTYENSTTPGGILCDQAGIYYVSQVNGGPFRLVISTNGGPWTTALALDGYSAVPQGHFTNVVLPLDRYRVGVESDAGLNFIIGPSLVAASTNGIHVAYIDWEGISLGQVTNVPLSIREPILAALQPDLLVWHMKEDDWAATAQRMAACESWWSNTIPNCDVLYIGTPWVSIDTNSTWTMDQDTVYRNTALAYHRTYVDLLAPTISYTWLLTNGYMYDATHLNAAGGLFCSDIIWKDLNFFALGLDRRLTSSQNGTQMQLSYNTSTNAAYRLEASTNLQYWTVAFTNPIATATFTTNFTPPTVPVFYRLGLSPP